MSFSSPAIRLHLLFIALLLGQACSFDEAGRKKEATMVHLITLAPGHFHAALLQKYKDSRIDTTVYVFAPDGPELSSHLGLIQRYNSRAEDPTDWKEKVYAAPDFLEKMLQDKPGNVVVIAGNNRNKTDYIKRAVDAGLNVLADKPMVITPAGFDTLQETFASAGKNKVLLYDIMTERYEITNRLLKELTQLHEVFGELKKGTREHPAVTVESVHYFYKVVSGAPLVRPAWYFDVRQQGEGLADVTTHLVDLVQWECFPGQVLDHKKDIQMLAARHWPTILTPSEFARVTNEKNYPDFLGKDLKDSLLHVYANGEMDYTIKGVHVRLSVAWKYQAPEGTGDTYYAKLQGTKADLIIRQGKEEAYKPVLYVMPIDSAGNDQHLAQALDTLREQYPGISAAKSGAGWKIMIPESYDIGHEQHFAQVVKKYLEYLQQGSMPDWEIAGMLTKYYTLMQAVKMAGQQQ